MAVFSISLANGGIGINVRNGSFNGRLPEQGVSDPSSVGPGPIAYDLKLGSYTFKIPPEISYSQRKNVVETAIVGRRGTVKEIVGASDWDITIQGVLTNEDTLQAGNGLRLVANTLPLDQVRALYEQAFQDAAIKVVSDFFELINVQYIVVKQISFPFKKGLQAAVPFFMRCVSDTDAKLILLEDDLRR